MNWIRQNKFLTGFIAVMVIGVGGLGYLVYSAWGNYNDVTDQYNEQAGALHQLQSRVPYPDENNLAKYQEQRDSLVDATHSLATELSKMVLPVQEMTPSGFQDQLRDTAATVTGEAAKAGVTLPKDFALDFDKYKISPPTDEAAAPLGRQLAALKIAMEILINEHVDAVTGLTRVPLSQEGAAGAGRTAGGGGLGGGFGGGGRGGFGGGGGGGFGGRGGRNGGGGGGGGGGGLVESYPFEVHFTASQPAFQKVLDDFAASKQQFFITRTLTVQNSNPKPVSKDDTSAAPPPAPAATPETTGTDNSGAAPAQELSFIVGTEKLDVVMRVDLVAFNPPPESTTGRRGGGTR